jgi:hypothetical protein
MNEETSPGGNVWMLELRYTTDGAMPKVGGAEPSLARGRVGEFALVEEGIAEECVVVV